MRPRNAASSTLKIRNMKTTLLFLQGIGIQEILLIGIFVLVFFGAKKIPEFMKGLGKGVREFKDGVKEVKNDLDGHTSITPANPKVETEIPTTTETVLK